MLFFIQVKNETKSKNFSSNIMGVYMRYIAISLIILVLLSGCSNSIGNPTASDILKYDADADRICI